MISQVLKHYERAFTNLTNHIIRPRTDTDLEKYVSNLRVCFEAFTDSFGEMGQGPYFGRGACFARFHREKVQSPIDRCVTRNIRVIDVLDQALDRRQLLVGKRCVHTDFSFVTWARVAKELSKVLSKADIVDSASSYPERLARFPLPER